MPKILFALICLTLSAPAFAGADLSKNAASYDGQYSFDLMNRPEIRAIVETTGGAKAVIEKFSTAHPGAVTNGRFLSFGGCMPHACNMDGFVAVIDLKTSAMLIVYSAKEFMSDKTVIVQDANDAWLEQNLSIASIPMNIANELMEFDRGITAANN